MSRDWSVPPGETLAEALQERHMDQRTLARLTGFTEKHVSRVINGRSGIGMDFALALEAVLRTNARLWLGLQLDHDLFLARRSAVSHPPTEESRDE